MRVCVRSRSLILNLKSRSIMHVYNLVCFFLKFFVLKLCIQPIILFLLPPSYCLYLTFFSTWKKETMTVSTVSSYKHTKSNRFIHSIFMYGDLIFITITIAIIVIITCCAYNWRVVATTTSTTTFEWRVEHWPTIEA